MAQADPPIGTDPPAGNRFKEFFAFFGGSAIGLGIDLVGFQVLLLTGVATWLANVLSAGTSVTVVYFLVTRFAFGHRARPVTYILFVCWYATSILVFSFLIYWATINTGFAPIIWKVVSVPFSFAANYMFSRYLFGAGRGRSPDPAS